jgi:hypothetical protein
MSEYFEVIRFSADNSVWVVWDTLWDYATRKPTWDDLKILPLGPELTEAEVATIKSVRKDPLWQLLAE